VVAIALGVGVGIGLWLLLIGLRPPMPSPASVLNSLRQARTATPSSTRRESTEDVGWSVKAGRPAVPVLAAIGLPLAKTRRDLKVLGRSSEELLASQVSTGVTALLLAPLTAAWFAMIGVPLPPAFLLGGTFVATAVMFWIPVLLIATQADAARAEQRDALSLYLDLVGSVLIAGGGVEQSLADAASIGDSPTFVNLRAALAKSRLARAPIPSVLDELADRTDSADLRETAASLHLAGTEGARIKEALAAKAVVMRARRLTEAQARAESATEQTGVPIALMFFAFLVTISFPAITNVLIGLG
jgi:tight adherence protein C